IKAPAEADACMVSWCGEAMQAKFSVPCADVHGHRARDLSVPCCDFRLDASVVEIKVEKVPVGDEPEEADTAYGEQNVPDSIPHPLLPVSPGDKGVEDGNERAESR